MVGTEEREKPGNGANFLYSVALENRRHVSIIHVRFVLIRFSPETKRSSPEPSN